MSIYRIADFNIAINNKLKYTSIACSDYLAEDQSVTADFAVCANRDDYESDKKACPGFSDGYLEFVSIYRQIARNILKSGATVLHACVVEKDGKGYAFAAPSGTGKSTHSALWLRAFPDSAHIVNGDKPVVRNIDGKLYAYGTPWCGKEGLNINTRVELVGICFLERAKENKIEPLSSDMALKKIFLQLLPPDNQISAGQFFDILEFIMQKVKFYTLHCNMELDAAYTAYEGMRE